MSDRDWSKHVLSGDWKHIRLPIEPEPARTSEPATQTRAESRFAELMRRIEALEARLAHLEARRR